MKKNFRTAVAALMASGLILGATATANAEPLEKEQVVNVALLGPDRSPRAPQRAVKAPVRRTRTTRRTRPVAAPPAPAVKPFVYKKKECKTLTDAPRDINGEQFICHSGPTFYSFDNGGVRLWTPNADQPVNRLGAMGADREFLNLEYGQRLGVWANGRIADSSPKQIVSDMVGRIKGITCGEWSKPKATNIAGIPVTRATGYDVHGNYFYDVIALKRFGNTYAFATRIPYKSQYSVHRNSELEWMVTHIHPTSWAE